MSLFAKLAFTRERRLREQYYGSAQRTDDSHRRRFSAALNKLISDAVAARQISKPEAIGILADFVEASKQARENAKAAANALEPKVSATFIEKRSK